MYKTNFKSLLYQKKESVTYEKYLELFKNNLGLYGIEYKEDLEELIKTLYKMDEEDYKKWCKVLLRVDYTLVFKNALSIIDIANLEEIDTSSELKDFFDICKKANSIIDNVYAKNYVEFINTNYGNKSYNNLLDMVNIITEEGNVILDRVYSEFDDFISEMQPSHFIVYLSDQVRETLKIKLIERGKFEIGRYKRFIETKIDNMQQELMSEKVLIEKRRKHARYN